MVALGKGVTPLPPPHRSRRALLTHRAAGASAGPLVRARGPSGADPRCSRDAGAIPRPHSRDCGSGATPRPWSSSPARASRRAPRSSPPSWCCSGARPDAEPAMSSPTTCPGIEDGPRVFSGRSARPPKAPGPIAPGPIAPGPIAPARPRVPPSPRRSMARRSMARRSMARRSMDGPVASSSTTAPHDAAPVPSAPLLGQAPRCDASLGGHEPTPFACVGPSRRDLPAPLPHARQASSRRRRTMR